MQKAEMDKKQWFLVVVLVTLTLITGVRLFSHLGAQEIVHTDEAWYGVNTVEMFTSGNWLVPTLQYQVDYGSKPPLHLWLILTAYRLLGVSEFSLRLPSAIAGAILFLCVILYLWKQEDLTTAVLFAAAFPALRECFRFHMFRAGDADALFGLFFVLAMIALKQMEQGHSRYVFLFGISCGLGFLCKSMHAALFVLIALLYLPAVFRKLKWKEVVAAILLGLLPIAVWLAFRYAYDGLEYIKAIGLGEVFDQVDQAAGDSDSYSHLHYLRTILKEKMTILLAVILAGRLVLNIRHLRTGLISWLKKRYLWLLACIVPLALYSCTSTYMEWYTYPCYLAEVVLIALEGRCLIRQIGELPVPGKWAPRIAAAAGICIVAFCVVYTAKQIMSYPYLGTGGGTIQEFRHDMAEYYEQNGDRYMGTRAYFAKDRGRIAGGRDHWELPNLYYAERIGLDCRDGGVEAFLEDEDSLIVLDGELWSEYEYDLTGHVFLEMNTFFVMNHEYY